MFRMESGGQVLSIRWAFTVATVGVLLALAPLSAHAQSGANRLRGPAPAVRDPEVVALLERERFRRESAEAAQKQLELMAEKLRQELVAEVKARQEIEQSSVELAARVTLADQIDQERQRLRSNKVSQLEQKVAELTERLASETAQRRSLEKELKRRATGTPANSADGDLKSRISELERKLKAAEWAHKLAEAQLDLLNGRGGRQR